MRQGFFDALRACPDDDATRLIFADWLDDHGEDDQAEFIRLEVGLAHTDTADPTRPSLEVRSRELMKAHGDRWLGSPADGLAKCHWRGGLVERLEVAATATLPDLETLLSCHPVRELTLKSYAILPQLARSPALGWIRSLTVDALFLGRSGPRSVVRYLESLLDSPHLRGLEALSLCGSLVDNHMARALSRSAGLTGLRTLRLQVTSLSDAGVVEMLRPGVFSRLEEWDVHCPNASPLGLNHLFTLHRARNWRILSYKQPRFGGFNSLFGLSHCVNVRDLHVELPIRMEWETGALLHWLFPLQQLRRLHLEGPVDDDRIQELADWPGLARLELLYLHIPSGRQEQVRETLAASAFHNPATVVSL